MRAGLAAGGIAAIIAVLVSLPLHSPVDSVFNSATVAVACLALGAIAGVLWNRMGERPLVVNGVLVVLFVLVLVVALVGNSFLDRFASFVLPLAAIAFVVCIALTPFMSSYFNRPDLGWKVWTPVVPVVIALALGFALVTQGDAESGELALPPPPTAAPATAAPTVTATPAKATSVADAPTPTTTAPGATLAVLSTLRATAAAPTTSPTQAEPTEAVPATEPPSEPAGVGGQFVIVEGSEITFTVEEELGRAPVRFDAVISGTGLTGTANLDGGPSVVTLDLHSLSSDQQWRDQYIQSRMFPDTPDAVVTVDDLPDLPQGFFDGAETTGQLDGSLQIGDTVTPLVFDVTARKDGDVINILGKTSFTWEQLGLAKPTARSVVYLADEVRVQVLLVARAR